MGQSPAMSLTHRLREQARSHRCDARHNICGTTHYPVGDVRGYEGSECGVSFSKDVAAPPHSSERGPHQAGSHRCDARHNICGTTHYPVGDVRGYEGSECGVSFSMDVADPPHSSECRLSGPPFKRRRMLASISRQRFRTRFSLLQSLRRCARTKYKSDRKVTASSAGRLRAMPGEAR